MARRASSVRIDDLPPALRILIQAAEVECPPGHAALLTELAALALRKVPARGLFDPGTRDDHDLFTAIEAAANTHLGLPAARAAWHDALERAALPFDQRDAIETTAVRVQAISDTAHFYTGLAFGLAFYAMTRSA